MGCSSSTTSNINTVTVASNNQPKTTDSSLIKSHISSDLEVILRLARLPPGTIAVGDFTVIDYDDSLTKNTATLSVQENVVKISVTAKIEEIAATFYNSLHKLEFYFPHPLMQLNPKMEKLLVHAEKKSKARLEWKPRFANRGFHLRTDYPNEWFKGFLQNDGKIALQYIMWLVRNQQNVLEIVLLNSVSKAETAKCLREPFRLANQFGVKCGIRLSLESQMNSTTAHLINTSITDDLQLKKDEIKQSIDEYINTYPISFDFLSLDLGMSGRSSLSPESQILLIEEVRNILAPNKRKLFVKVNCNAKGESEPTLTDPAIGAFPSTTLFYGLNDANAGVCGNNDFSATRLLIFQEAHERPCWYHPETSSYLGQGLDVPLLLTDTLIARQADMKIAEDAGVEGHIASTCGMGMGHWLIDWTVALLNNKDYATDPYIGLNRMGEDVKVWENEVKFQTTFFKENSVLGMIVSALSVNDIKSNSVVRRNTLKDLYNDSEKNKAEIEILNRAVADMPEVDNSIYVPELKQMISVTHLRVQHALYLRLAIRASQEGNFDAKSHFLITAKSSRDKALSIIGSIVEQSGNHYSNSGVFSKEWINPTGYNFGYLWPASCLTLWEREEDAVNTGRYEEVVTNIYDTSGKMPSISRSEAPEPTPAVQLMLNNFEL